MDVFWISMAALLGLVTGSFLNVVVYRLPLMMQAHWEAECAQYVAVDTGQNTSSELPPRLSLVLPGSHCPHCGHLLRWWQNIPVLSWLLLRGRCRQCAVSISVCYPLVEIATALLFAVCIARWGVTPAGLLWCSFGATLLTLAVIDAQTTLLPDCITLPLLWGGLLVATQGWMKVPLADAVWGAALGYLSLWSVCVVFKWVTGKQGMGHGDFKLLAALGAWLGWQALLPVVLMSSIAGAMVGIGLKLGHRLPEDGVIPFGPFLAIAGFVVMWVGTERILPMLLDVMG